jgi:hypothetical protein
LAEKKPPPRGSFPARDFRRFLLPLPQVWLNYQSIIGLPPSLLRFSFLRKSKLVARKQERCAEKASAQLFRISDFFGFSFSIRIPQSAIRNLEAGPSGDTEFGIRNVEFGIFISFFLFRVPQSTFRI